MMRRILITLGPVIGAVALTWGYGSFVRLPHFFTYSDAVILGVLAGVTAFAAFLMMPDRWLHDAQDLLRHAFRMRHGIGDGRAASALATIATLRQHGARLERSAPQLSPELARRVERTHDTLDDLARLVFYEPDRVATLRAVTIRSESVIEAVETQVELRRAKADDATLGQARATVISALDTLDAALDHIGDQRIGALLDQIDVASETAEALLRTPQRHRTGSQA